MTRFLFVMNFWIWFLTSQVLMAQELRNAIKLQTRSTNHSIKLRWAPNSVTLWQLANKYGYTIERHLVTQNNKVVNSIEKKILTPTSLKPAQSDVWIKFMNDDNVAVAAQAIFGESFEVAPGQSSVSKIINRSRELESRFSFALFAADNSLKAAELSALYFEDETVAPNTRYLYRVYANLPEGTLSYDTAISFVGLQDYAPLPKISDLQAEFGDQHVVITWNGSLVERIYNCFWLERCVDGKDFARTTIRPIVNTFQSDTPKSALIFATDSLSSNGTKVSYRVVGINSFGEIGPPSDTVSGFGRPSFNFAASISQYKLVGDSVLLNWTFPSSGLSRLSSFDLIRIDQRSKRSSVIKKQIKAEARSIIDNAPLSTNYYVIRSFDKFGRSTDSFPYMVQLEDSIPPSPPQELTGKIDSLGKVSLSWKRNSETDLFGYSIFRSNFLSEDFIQLNGSISESNSFTDSISLKNLSEDIYYKVIALDSRYNPSGYSQTLKLKKPDQIRPVKPSFTKVRTDSSGVVIEWANSSSVDVESHSIYRRVVDEDSWENIYTVSQQDLVSTFTDTTNLDGNLYQYTIVAVDDDGLESLPATPVTAVHRTKPVSIDKLFYSIDRSRKKIVLNWSVPVDGVDKIFLYKSIDQAPMRLFRSLDGNEIQTVDEFKMTESMIEYRVVAVLKNGMRSKFSQPLMVKL